MTQFLLKALALALFSLIMAVFVYGWTLVVESMPPWLAGGFAITMMGAGLVYVILSLTRGRAERDTLPK